MREFVLNLKKSKRFETIDKFYDTSRYQTKNNFEYAKHTTDIYPTELQFNEANTLRQRNFLFGFKCFPH